MQPFSQPHTHSTKANKCCQEMWLLMIEKTFCKAAHLEQAKIPNVTPCLHRMRQGSSQLPNISEAKVDPLPSQRVHHVGRIPDQGQSGPHIPAGLTEDSPDVLWSLQMKSLSDMLSAGNMVV